MMKKYFMAMLVGSVLFSCKSENSKKQEVEINEEIPSENIETTESEIEINPVAHATAVVNWGDSVLYLDPTGGAEAFQQYEKPSLVLLTDIHPDHLNAETLQALDLGTTTIIAPQAVKDQLPDSLQQNVKVMANGDRIEEQGLKIEAIPMYNLREEAKQFHPKGRGNGYVIEKDGQRLYIAGDTEDIPEMRNLQNIDVALIPMNLPYTMPVEAAADAVLAFKPNKVYPYHFRGTEGMADVEKFKTLVNEKNEEIEVVLSDWYPEE